MHRIAVLDDYQSVAADFCDWSTVPEPVDVVEFHDTVDRRGRARRPPRALRRRRRHARADAVPAERPRAAAQPEAARHHRHAQQVHRHRRRPTTAASPSAAPAPADRHRRAHLGASSSAVTRHIPQEDAAVRAGGWQQTIGGDLAGARLGVVGLGRLGSRSRRIGQAFGMDVVAWSQNLTDERAAEHGVRRVDREELFATSDVVTVHLLWSKRTRGLIGADDFALHEARPPSSSTPAAARSSRRRRWSTRSARAASPAPGSTSTTRNRCRADRPAPVAAAHRPHPAPRLRHPRHLRGVLRRGRRGRRRLPPRARRSGSSSPPEPRVPDAGPGTRGSYQAIRRAELKPGM